MYQACQRSDVIDGGVEEDVKEVLREHVWMTMTNGLRVLLFEKSVGVGAISDALSVERRR